MDEQIIISRKAKTYYNFNLISSDSNHFINIYISKEVNKARVVISKSLDGFFFKSPCEEANELAISDDLNIEETCNEVKKFFEKKGYEYINLETLPTLL